jgi:hypothetical protein
LIVRRPYYHTYPEQQASSALYVTPCPHDGALSDSWGCYYKYESACGIVLAALSVVGLVHQKYGS